MASEAYEQSAEMLGEVLIEHTSNWQRFRKPLAFVAGMAALGAAYGAYRGATDDTDIRLGPHKAYAHVTTDETLTIHFARDEYLTKPIDGLVFGADVTLGDVELPVDGSGKPDFQNTASEYVQLFSANTNYLSTDVQHKIIQNTESAALLWGVLGGMAGISVLAVHLQAAKEVRQGVNEYLHQAQRSMSRIALGAMVVAIPSAYLLTDTFSPHSQQALALESGTPTSSVFKDTFLENAMIHGNLLEAAINQLAGPALEKIQSVNEYYGSATTSLTDLFHQTYGESFKPDGGVWALVLSDEHCNIGSFKFWGRAAELYSPDFVLLAGDQTNDGTEAEGVCVNNEAQALHDIPTVFTGGNHDSAITANQDRDNNIHADFGHVDTVAGFTVYTEADPRLNSFGGEQRKTSETDDQFRARINHDICLDKPDIALIHDPSMVFTTVQQGCAKLTVSGHLHEQSGPFRVSNTGKISYDFVQGTSGGIRSNMLSVLYFQNEAPAIGSMLKFDPVTHELLGRIDIMLNTDGTPKISDFIPVAQAEPLPLSSSDYNGRGD